MSSRRGAIAFLACLLLAGFGSTQGREHDCTMQKPEDWGAEKRVYCCKHPPYYCEPYTLGCNAPCLYANVTLSCQARISFRLRVSYTHKRHKDNGCLKAYWDVMDQCPVCHTCGAASAGCGQQKHDCRGDPDLEKWDIATREFCCLKTGIACPSLVEPPIQVKPVLFDCEDHHWDWSSAWSHEQKQWCCENKKKGCKGMSESKAPESKAHIPDADFQIVLRAQHMSQETPRPPTTLAPPAPVEVRAPADTTTTTTTKPFRCQVALNNFRAAWSKAKKEWCCTNENKGCDVSAPAVQMDYDCNSPDVLGWSRAKKDWCCTHRVIGCDTEDDGAGFVVETPLSQHAEGEGQGGQEQPMHQDNLEGNYNQFDCTVEVDNWQFAWAEEQKQACCQTVGIGCKSDEIDFPEPSEADFFFDCSKGQSEDWSFKKRQVCCSTSNANCATRYK